MAAVLPDQFDPTALADAGRHVRGEQPLARYERILADCGPQAGQVRIDLAFGVDAEGTRYIEGGIDTAVRLTCNRCLQPYEQALHCQVELGIAATAAQAAQLPARYDPLVLTGRTLSLQQLVEDELLLALPLVPAHPDGACAAPGAADAVAGSGAERASPFAELARLRSAARGAGENQG